MQTHLGHDGINQIDVSDAILLIARADIILQLLAVFISKLVVVRKSSRTHMISIYIYDIFPFNQSTGVIHDTARAISNSVQQITRTFSGIQDKECSVQRFDIGPHSNALRKNGKFRVKFLERRVTEGKEILEL